MSQPKNSNRDRLRKLITQANITQAECAEHLCFQTQRPCSVRAVQSWLNNPDRPSARPCPDWVIEVLEKALHE